MLRLHVVLEELIQLCLWYDSPVLTSICNTHPRALVSNFLWWKFPIKNRVTRNIWKEREGGGVPHIYPPPHPLRPVMIRRQYFLIFWKGHYHQLSTETKNPDICLGNLCADMGGGISFWKNQTYWYFKVNLSKIRTIVNNLANFPYLFFFNANDKLFLILFGKWFNYLFGTCTWT